VVLALPNCQQVVPLDVEVSCTARQAVKLALDAGLDAVDDELDVQKAPLGVYGLRVDDNAQLQNGDRVEIYRSLQQDPMELRRQRAALESTARSVRRK